MKYRFILTAKSILISENQRHNGILIYKQNAGILRFIMLCFLLIILKWLDDILSYLYWLRLESKKYK